MTEGNMVAARIESHDTAALKPIPEFPGGSALLGHVADMQADPLALVTRVRDQLGDVGAVKIGFKRVIVVTEPHAIERILVENVKNYTKQTRGYAQLRRMLGNGLVTSEGSFWLRQRRIAQPAFHREKLAGLSRIMVRDTDDMIAGVKDDVAFDLNLAMTKLTMRIIGEALFSVDVSGATDAAGTAINELVHQAMTRTINIHAPMFVPTPMNRRFKNSKKLLDDMVLDLIADRRAGKHDAHGDLLSMLMDAVDEETGERMNNEQLRDEVLTLFAAGHETTSMAVSWTIHELLDVPDVLARLRAEIDAAREADGSIAVERVMRMTYLDAVLKESLRKDPPVWNVARFVENDDELCGFHIPKGELVFASQWLMHRHPKYWPEPLRFDPTRFLDENANNARPKYAYFPFLGGPRKCIGDQLSLLESKIILAKLLATFDFAREPGHPVIPDPAITLRMKQGLWVRARRRS